MIHRDSIWVFKKLLWPSFGRKQEWVQRSQATTVGIQERVENSLQLERNSKMKNNQRRRNGRVHWQWEKEGGRGWAWQSLLDLAAEWRMGPLNEMEESKEREIPGAGIGLNYEFYFGDTEFKILNSFFFFFFFFWPRSQHTKVSRPGIELAPQWPCWILNLLGHQGTPPGKFCLRMVML